MCNLFIRESTTNLSGKEGIYATLPKSLTTQDVLVRIRTENPEVLKERQALLKAKSISELAHVSGLGDFPIPANIERLFQGKPASQTQQQSSSPEPPKSMKENFYATLPRSMKADVLVRSRLEDPEVLKDRQSAVKNMSVSELAHVSGLSDMPIPTTLENLFKGKKEER